MISLALRTLLVATLLTSPLFAASGAPQSNPSNPDRRDHNEETIAQLEYEMAHGTLTSEQLTRYYIDRINAMDQSGPGVNSVIELNPDALAMARYADQLRRHGHVLGPMHGIPVLLKANVDTHDHMQTSAGSFALVGTPALQDSTVAAKLRAGGAVILGKTNLSEWANFRSFESISGWSGVGGQTNNPYGIARNPCGSSAGSAAGVSSNFTAVSFGTETDGSIVCPGNANGVVGLKPTPNQPRWYRTDLPHPGHLWAAWPICGGRGRRSRRSAEQDLMMAVIRRPAGFRWVGKAGSPAPRIFPPTTPNS